MVYSEDTGCRGLPKVRDPALSNSPAFPANLYPLILTVDKLWFPLFLSEFTKSRYGLHEETINKDLCQKGRMVIN